MNDIYALEHPELPSALRSDDDFDSLLPVRAQARSAQFWTPLAVARRAARLFRRFGATSVLDVGCGPGKFCIAASAAEPELRFTGVEQRAALVLTARKVARRLRGHDVHFYTSDAVEISWDEFDGFYFFNPFVENVYPKQVRYDASVVLSSSRFAADLMQIEIRLAATRVGTVVVTYHGLGGPIPSSFEPVHSEPAGSDHLRVWLKQRRAMEDWCWVDQDDEPRRAPRGEIHESLLALSREDETGCP